MLRWAVNRFSVPVVGTRSDTCGAPPSGRACVNAEGGVEVNAQQPEPVDEQLVHFCERRRQPERLDEDVLSSHLQRAEAGSLLQYRGVPCENGDVVEVVARVISHDGAVCVCR